MIHQFYEYTIFLKSGKNPLIFLIIITMIASLLSCGGKANARPENQMEVNKTGYPILNEMTVFDVGIVTDISEEELRNNQYLIYDQLAEKTNVKINWKPLPMGNHVTKLILQLVSGTYPEAFQSHSLDPYDWQRLSDQGFLVPLEGYVEEGWMPRLKSLLDERPSIMDSIWMGDHYYSLPVIEENKSDVNYGSMLHLNKKWMDALALEVPNDTEELYQVLKAFKEQDPNGNGKDDEIPLTAVWQDQSFGLWSLFSAWGIIDNQWFPYMIKNGNVVIGTTLPEYRDAVIYFRKLYNEGLLDIEFISQDLGMFNSKIRNNQTGAWLGWPREDLANSTEDARWNRENALVVPPLRTPEGTRFWYSQAINAPGTFEITSKCRSPEALLRWADEFYDEEIGFQLRYGVFGQNPMKREDGMIEFLDQPEGFNIWSITMPNSPLYLSFEGIKSKMVKSPMDVLWTEYGDMYNPHAAKEVYPKMSFNNVDNRRSGSIIADMVKLIHNKQVSWIIGESRIEEEWDNYLAELEKMGHSELIEILQKNYDQYLERKKSRSGS